MNRWHTDTMGREHDLGPADEQLDYDTVEALGLDGTGRDGDPRFPYTLGALTESEVARVVAWRSGRFTYHVQPGGASVYLIDQFQRVRGYEVVIDPADDASLAEAMDLLLVRTTDG